MATSRAANHAKLAALVIVLVALAFAWRSGVFAQVGSPKALAVELAELGAWGYLAFIIAYAVFQPFGVPGTLFVATAPLIWPWQTAFVLSMIGTMAASVIGFSFARFVARDWVAARIPKRLRKYEEALERSAFLTVVLLRLIFWMPQVLHFFLGVSRVRFWTHFWGSLLGYIPPLLLLSYLAGKMFDASGHIQSGAWPPLAGLVGTSLLLAALARTYERRRAARASPAQ
ncbi:MAG: TVP38/TMEM64 family protein [Deltaproteobacteria bacterium]|nr:TVP38/TMEM64 family protein [Deltaproteobacteria bacterium]